MHVERRRGAEDCLEKSGKTEERRVLLSQVRCEVTSKSVC
jgi:hypothetical protein